MDALPVFFIAIASGVVMGIATLLIVYKMIDGSLPVAAGGSAMILIVVSMALAIHPPHPIVPGVVLIVALTLMAFFPFAAQVLERFELQAIDADQIARSYAAVEARPDNFASKFELARQLYDHAFYAQAINLTSQTLASLGTETDQVKNQSLRDVFHREELMLRRWKDERKQQDASSFVCPGCGATNSPADIFCTSCNRPYMLDIVRGQQVKPRVWAKLVLGWSLLALFIPGFVGIGMSLDGALRLVAFIVAFAGVAGLLAWLFRPPRHSVTIYAME